MTVASIYPIHTVFDFLAALSAVIGGWLAYKWRFQKALEMTASSVGPAYFLALSFGSIVGAYLIGSLNLYFSGVDMIGRSILGALAGATVTVEFYKKKKGIANSTGYVYVIPFSLCVIIGRIGCFLSGLDDQTFGTETELPWGWDFGDGIKRHPVQLYESISMTAFLAAALFFLMRRDKMVIRYGYYLCVGFYAAQRFVWEFLKPYGNIVGPFNLLQFVCAALIVYSAIMIYKVKNAGSAA